MTAAGFSRNVVNKAKRNIKKGRKQSAKRDVSMNFKTEVQHGSQDYKKKRKENQFQSADEEEKMDPNSLSSDGSLCSSTNGMDHKHISEHPIVRVFGSKVNPLNDFEEAKFDHRITRFLRDSNFSKPTKIQAYCIPPLLSGHDIVGIAETGSGKTLSFLLPGIARILLENPGKSRISMLVLSPTRELALQTNDVLEKICRTTNLYSVCVYGGVSKTGQKEKISSRNGIHIVIATPGRLIDLYDEGILSLSDVNFLVLDEADRMLDMGFERDVRRIISMTNKNRQTAMFSATWPNEIQRLAANFLSNPVRVATVGDDLTANTNVTQIVEIINQDERRSRLLQLLKEYHSSRCNRILIFALYKYEASALEKFLMNAGYSAIAIHGNKSQNAREHALSSFRSSKIPLLIATDVAARGLDIPDVEYVINFSYPLETSSYIHRIGRTGRAGRAGVSHTFFHAGNKPKAGELINVLTEAGQNVPVALLKFGTHVKKKKHDLYGNFTKDISSSKKSNKVIFNDN